jgi:CRP-like cAMP-binding protein
LQEHFDVLQSVGLFAGIDATDLESALQCLGAEITKASRDEVVLLAGEKPRHVGIVLSGQLHIVREGYEGNRSLEAAITPGGIFGESLCCAGVAESPVTVIATSDATVMLLRFQRVLHTCANTCAFHQKLIENMLRLVAEKNLFLKARMEIMTLKSIRAKVLQYLESCAPERGQGFSIPFNREEMAGYLCVERSALSHELIRMKQDGLIAYRKNQFTLK